MKHKRTSLARAKRHMEKGKNSITQHGKCLPSCRVRVCERATKKDHDRFIRTRVARARILKVAAFQASCGGQKNLPSSNRYLAPYSSITNCCLKVYQRRGTRVGTRYGMHLWLEQEEVASTWYIRFCLIGKFARVTVVQEIMNLWKVCCTSSTRMNLTPGKMM